MPGCAVKKMNRWLISMFCLCLKVTIKTEKKNKRDWIPFPIAVSKHFKKMDGYPGYRYMKKDFLLLNVSLLVLEILSGPTSLLEWTLWRISNLLWLFLHLHLSISPCRICGYFKLSSCVSSICIVRPMQICECLYFLTFWYPLYDKKKIASYNSLHHITFNKMCCLDISS